MKLALFNSALETLDTEIDMTACALAEMSIQNSIGNMERLLKELEVYEASKTAICNRISKMLSEEQTNDTHDNFAIGNGGCLDY
jgi:hypothetical protein